jgi:predicted transcriptional regulator
MKRGRIDIIIDVLETAKVEVNKTRIVYKANLNFKIADKYLGLLQKNGLIEKKMDKYIITEKGKRFLERAQDMVLNYEAVPATSFILTFPLTHSQPQQQQAFHPASPRT